MKDTLVITDEPLERIEVLYDGERFVLRRTWYSNDWQPEIHTAILSNPEAKKLFNFMKKYFGGER